jgi:CRP-like cAMP-binding protein
MSTGPEQSGASGLPEALQLAGDEAVLPAGSRLCDEERPGRQCFVILEGAATVQRDGSTLRSLSSGAFVGAVSADGRPLAPCGVTIRLDIRSRVLVLDPARLAALLDAEPGWASAWRSGVLGL